MKIAYVVGARPQFIEAVLVSKDLRKSYKEVLVHTGQHYDIGLSKIFFDELGTPKPDYNLEVGSETHAGQTAMMMISIEDTLVAEKPNFVLVYGDINLTLVGALAAVKLYIPLAHIEAALRFYDQTFTEEINYFLINHILDYLFTISKYDDNSLRK